MGSVASSSSVFNPVTRPSKHEECNDLIHNTYFYLLCIHLHYYFGVHVQDFCVCIKGIEDCSQLIFRLVLVELREHSKTTWTNKRAGGVDELSTLLKNSY